MHSPEKLGRSGKFEAIILAAFQGVNCVDLARPVKPEEKESSVNSENDDAKSIQCIQAPENAEDQSDQSEQSEQDSMDRNRDDEIDANSEKELDEVWLQILSRDASHWHQLQNVHVKQSQPLYTFSKFSSYSSDLR